MLPLLLSVLDRVTSEEEAPASDAKEEAEEADGAGELPRKNVDATRDGPPPVLLLLLELLLLKKEDGPSEAVERAARSAS